jgi:hypothetical protein
LNREQRNSPWINPLLTRLKLIPVKEENTDPRPYWNSIEECKLLERIGRVVGEVNAAAGYHLLEMQEYLPPQKTFFHINFDRNRVQYRMELVLREDGIVLVFSSAKHVSARWDRYFPQSSRKDNSNVAWEQVIHPAEILEQNIQAWLSYLLSGLDKQFRLDQILNGITPPEANLSAALRKISA